SRVFVGPGDLSRTNLGETMIYHLLLPGYVPAGYFLEMNPGIANREGSRLANDLATADVLLLSGRFDKWNEPNAARDAGTTEPVRVLKEKFRVVSKHGPYAVLGRK